MHTGHNFFFFEKKKHKTKYGHWSKKERFGLYCGAYLSRSEVKRSQIMEEREIGEAIDIIKYFTDSHNIIFVYHLKVVQAICVRKIIITSTHTLHLSNGGSSGSNRIASSNKRVVIVIVVVSFAASAGTGISKLWMSRAVKSFKSVHTTVPTKLVLFQSTLFVIQVDFLVRSEAWVFGILCKFLFISFDQNCMCRNYDSISYSRLKKKNQNKKRERRRKFKLEKEGKKER